MCCSPSKDGQVPSSRSQAGGRRGQPPGTRRVAFLGPDQAELDEGPRVQPRPKPTVLNARFVHPASKESPRRVSFQGEEQDDPHGEHWAKQMDRDADALLQSLRSSPGTKSGASASPSKQAHAKSMRPKVVSPVRMFSSSDSPKKDSFERTPSGGTSAAGRRPMPSPRQAAGNSESFERTGSAGRRPMPSPRQAAGNSESFERTGSAGRRPMPSPRQAAGNSGSFERTGSAGRRPMSSPRGQRNVGGVGIVWVCDYSKGFCRVAAISGAAEESGQVSVGDGLLAVDGTNAKGLTILDVGQKVLGPPDTSVELDMIDAETMRRKYVILQRRLVQQK